jgi:hypothetical protein
MTGICCSIASRSQRLSSEFWSVRKEGVIDDIISGIDLLMGLALIMTPDPASGWSGERSADGTGATRFGGA